MPNRAGYDFIIQGMGGMMSVTGLPDGEPGGGPMRAGVAIADLFTGMYACVAILAALHRREKTGEGAHIDMALFDTQLAMLANQASNALISGEEPPRQGNTHPNIVPYQPFDAADQPIIIAVGNDRQFARLAEICGHPEWAKDERFASNGARVANRGEIVGLSGRVHRREAGGGMAREAGCGGNPGRADQPRQPGAGRRPGRSTGAWCGQLSGVPLVGSPVRIDGERADSELPPPALGEHTDEVLRELGLSDDEVERLKGSRVIG